MEGSRRRRRGGGRGIGEGDDKEERIRRQGGGDQKKRGEEGKGDGHLSISSEMSSGWQSVVKPKCLKHT